MNKIEVFDCDFNNSNHCIKLVQLMNDYITDEMGGGELIEGEKVNQLIQGLKNHPSKLILFVSLNNEIAGLTNCFINFGTFAAAPFINIHDIIINKAFRGNGLGRVLMISIIEKANQLKCAKITLEVREDNRTAQNLYKSLGFNECAPRMYFWSKYIN